MAPIPLMAVVPAKVWRRGDLALTHRPHEVPGRGQRQHGPVPVTWSPRLLAPRTATSTTPRPSARPVGPRRVDRAGERHGVARVVGRAQADGDTVSMTAPGPAQSVTKRPTKPLVREDVHEDVGGAALDGQARVVVDVLVVARGDGGGHDEGAGRAGWRARGARRPPRPRRIAAGGRAWSRPSTACRRARQRSGHQPGAQAGQLGARALRASARSACPTGSSGGSGSRCRRPGRRGGAGWRAPRAGPLPTPTTGPRPPPRSAARPLSRRHAACHVVTRMASVSM